MSRRYEKGDDVTVSVDRTLVTATYDGDGTAEGYPGYAMILYNGRRMPRKIKDNLGAKKPTDLAPPLKQSRFDVNRRFQFIENSVNMVIKGDSKSLIVSGSGGLGKTFTVRECLDRAGLRDVDDFEENEDTEELGLEQEKLGDFTIVKGFSTPKALYRLLWQNKDRIIIFDDCDSVWNDDTSVSLLKCALDSYETRRIHWLSMIKDESDLPQSFEFTGKVIFVSNLSLTQLDQAVLSRCLYVDVSMTSQEKIDRIKNISGNIRQDMPDDQKAEALKLLEEHKDNIGDLNIRTYMKVLEIRHAHKDAQCPDCKSTDVSTPDPQATARVDRVLYKCRQCKKEFKRDEAYGDWRDMAEYVITAF